MFRRHDSGLSPKASRKVFIVLVSCVLLPQGILHAASLIGDAGHFLYGQPRIHLNNPKGEAFSVTVHRHIWVADPRGKGTYEVKVIGPGDETIATGEIPFGKPRLTLKVADAKRGVYAIEYKRGGYGLTWVESSLDQMVVATGDWDMKTGWHKTFSLHCMVPRRWYFFVPKGTRRFRIKTTGGVGFTSTREDHGFLVMNPRGQRVEAVYGGVPPRKEERDARAKKGFVSTERVISTDEGTTGRFWSIWVTGGDSHNYSDLQILLNGVPAYFAPSPEQWFDPGTGKAPKKLIYDESQIRALDKQCKTGADGRRLSRDHYMWCPTPFLGDEGYCGMRGSHAVFINNPKGRALDFGTCSYVVPKGARVPVSYVVTSPAGEKILEKKDSYAWRDSSRIAIPGSGKGVYRVDVNCEKWFAWAEPVPPMVLGGHASDDGRSVFRMQIGIDRHWFFRVPEGTASFEFGALVKDPMHVLRVEIHGPDRVMEALYVRGGKGRASVKVDVPPSLRGKIWFLRLGVGSATRFLSVDAKAAKHVRIDADVDLKGVPGYLAPTWEQWFQPEKLMAGPSRRP